MSGQVINVAHVNDGRARAVQPGPARRQSGSAAGPRRQQVRRPPARRPKPNGKNPRAPNQEAVFRQAAAVAGLNPDEVGAKIPSGSAGVSSTATVSDVQVLTPANAQPIAVQLGQLSVNAVHPGVAGSIVLLVAAGIRNRNTNPDGALYLDSSNRIQKGAAPVPLASILAFINRGKQGIVADGQIHPSRLVKRSAIVDQNPDSLLVFTDAPMGTIVKVPTTFDADDQDFDTLTEANPGLYFGPRNIEDHPTALNVLADWTPQRTWLGSQMPATKGRIVNCYRHFTPSMSGMLNQGFAHVIPITASSFAEAMSSVQSNYLADLMGLNPGSRKIAAKETISICMGPDSVENYTQFKPFTDDISDPGSVNWPGYWLVVYTGLDSTARIELEHEMRVEHQSPTSDPLGTGNTSAYKVCSNAATPCAARNDAVVQTAMNLLKPKEPVLAGVDKVGAKKKWWQTAIDWIKPVWDVGKTIAKFIL